MSSLVRLLILGLVLLPASSLAVEFQDLEFRLQGAGLVGTSLIRDIPLSQRNFRLALAPETEYAALGLAYPDILADLSAHYRLLDTTSALISINFPYRPVVPLDILIELSWTDGRLYKNYRFEPTVLGLELEGELLARISPAEVLTESAAQVTGEQSDSLPNEILVISGDSLENLAQAIQQVYLQDLSVSQEVIISSLREQNPAALNADGTLRLGAALAIPDYYELSSLDEELAQLEVRRAITAQQPARPRLEITPVNSSSSTAQPSLVQAPPGAASQDSLANSSSSANPVVSELPARPRESAVTEDAPSLVSPTTELGQLGSQLSNFGRALELAVTRLFALEAELSSRELSTRTPQTLSPFTNATAAAGGWFTLLQAEFNRDPVLVMALMVFLLCLVLLMWFLWYRYWSRRRFQTVPVVNPTLALETRPATSPLVPGMQKPKPPKVQPRGLNSAAAAAKFITAEKEATTAVDSAKLAESQGEFLHDSQHNANLDLARAYINMGEMAKARAMLEEVMEGDDALSKTQAVKMLSELKQ